MPSLLRRFHEECYTDVMGRQLGGRQKGKTDLRDLQLKKFIFMFRALYLILLVLSLMTVISTGYRYITQGIETVQQMELLLLGMLILLVAFNGYFVFRDSNLFRRLNSQLEIKDESYRNIEALNLELRGQRHDFLNHIQILYSLMELEAYEDTRDYLNRLYGDVGRLSANIKTKSVAFNALLQAKANEAETIGVTYSTVINSRLDRMNMPEWEVCRVVGNMIDNGFRAALKTEDPFVGIVLSEHITDYELIISNSSQPIEAKAIKGFFAPGFTTKKYSEGHGMGLYISKELMARYQNDLQMAYKDGQVTVRVSIGKATANQ